MDGINMQIQTIVDATITSCNKRGCNVERSYASSDIATRRVTGRSQWCSLAHGGIVSLWFYGTKEGVIIHDRSIIGPCPISTPASIQDLDLRIQQCDQQRGDMPRHKHTTARRGRGLLSLPPPTPTRPLHTFESPASQTSGLSKAPGWLSKPSNLT